MIRRAVVVALCLVGSPAAAHGGGAAARGTLQDGEHNYQIAVATGWRPIDAAAGTLLAYEGPGKKAHLTITRVEIGRVPDKAEQPRMVDEIERGVERSTRSYKRVKRKLSVAGIVPVLDLVYQRSAPAGGHGLMLSRFLLFRRHTVVLSIGVEPDAREARRDAEAMIRASRRSCRERERDHHLDVRGLRHEVDGGGARRPIAGSLRRSRSRASVAGSHET